MNIWDDEWGEQGEDWSGGGGRGKRLVASGPELGASLYELERGNFALYHAHAARGASSSCCAGARRCGHLTASVELEEGEVGCISRQGQMVRMVCVTTPMSVFGTSWLEPARRPKSSSIRTSTRSPGNRGTASSSSTIWRRTSLPPPRPSSAHSLCRYSRLVVPLRILLRPNPSEYRLFREQYEELAEDLEEEGVLVRLLPTAEVHAHAALPTGSWENGEEDYNLVIQVGSSAEEIVGTARLVEFVQRRLRGLEQPDMALRRANIYLSNGEKHEFRLDADE